MRRSEVHFLTLEEVVVLHALQLTVGPESLPGIKDPGWLESAVMAPQNSYACTLAGLATDYAVGLGKGHAFNDANKRTALQSASVFLLLNGFPLVLTKETEDLMVAIAAGAAHRDALEAHLATLMGGDEPVED